MSALTDLKLTAKKAQAPVHTVADSILVKAKDLNDLIDLLNSGDMTTTGDQTFEGDVTINGTTTLNGTLVLGDAAADAIAVGGTATYSEVINYSNETGITAGTTQTQGGATALTEELNNVSTVGTAGDGIKLKAAVAGAHQYIKNSGANILAIYPATSDSIDALAVNLPIRLQPGSSMHFYAKDATVWESSIDNSITLNAPTTAKGQLEIKAADSTGNTVTTIINASQAAARTYTIPDAGANASFVQTEGAQTINGVKTIGSPIVYSSATSITAFEGGGQASAVALTKEFNEITTCATAGDSVKLPAAVAGQYIVVKNNGATAADVFPASGDSIDAAAADTAIRLAVGAKMSFRAIDGTVWESSFIGSGTVGNPSLPVGTTNKGFYEVSTNQLGTSVNGTLVAIADTLGLTADSFRNRVNLGTTPVGTVSVVEYGDSRDITTVLTLTNFIVGALDGAAAAKGIGNIVYAFPAGQHFELVYSLSDIVLTAAGTAVATDTGLGSVIASGVVSVLSGTATFEDRLTGQTINTAAGGGAAASALTAATAGIGTGISLNVAGSVKNVFLNSAGTWNVDNTGNLTATGTIVLKWTRM